MKAPAYDRLAVEPSPVMIAQRPAGAGPAIEGVAEALPLDDGSVDATMGVFTMQHWDDVDRGLAEVLRVTRERAVFLTLDVDVTAEMWLCRDYLRRPLGPARGPSRPARAPRLLDLAPAARGRGRACAGPSPS